MQGGGGGFMEGGGGFKERGGGFMEGVGGFMEGVGGLMNGSDCFTVGRGGFPETIGKTLDAVAWEILSISILVARRSSSTLSRIGRLELER